MVFTFPQAVGKQQQQVASQRLPQVSRQSFLHIILAVVSRAGLGIRVYVVSKTSILLHIVCVLCEKSSFHPTRLLVLIFYGGAGWSEILQRTSKFVQFLSRLA